MAIALILSLGAPARGLRKAYAVAPTQPSAYLPLKRRHIWGSCVSFAELRERGLGDVGAGRVSCRAAAQLEWNRGACRPRAASRWADMDELPACGEWGGDQADVSNHPRVGNPEANLRRLACAGQAVQHHIERMVELLRTLLSISDAASLRSLRSQTAMLGTTQIPQACGSATPAILAAADRPATPAAVHPLARFWKSQGSDDGSRMTGDCHVRFCEGLRLKRWGLLSYRRYLLHHYASGG